MKRLDETLDIGPRYAAEFERAGIRNVRDLATISDPVELGNRTGIPVEFVQQWHNEATRKLKASRYRRIVAVVLALASVAGLGWLYVRYVRSPTRAAARLSAQAVVLYDQGSYDQALSLWEQAIALDPMNEKAWANKGGVLERLERSEEALKALNKALELDLNDSWSFSRRGDVYYNLKKYPQAVDDYKKSISLDPNYKLAFRGEGLTLFALERHNEALQALNAAIALDDKDSFAHSIRGGVYHEGLFQYENAYQDLKKANDLEPTSPVYEADLAESALTTERFQEAVDRATRILADKENTKRTISERLAMRFVAISALLLAGNKDEAKKQLKEFSSDFKSVPADFEQDWDFSGDKHFVENRDLNPQTKKLINDLILLLKDPQKSSIDRVEGLASRLS